MIITENLFIEYIKNVQFSQLRTILKQQRLRLDKSTIAFYLYCIFLHTSQQKSFKYIHSQYFSKRYKTKYSTFMHNIKNISLLFNDVFNYTKKLFSINKNNTTIVDTTLIQEKLPQFITSKDWKNSRVTKRDKINVCGSKGLVFMNLKKQIIYADLININYSDQNILKDSAMYAKYLSKYLLADRGFNSKLSKQRLYNYGCLLITPNHYKVVQKTGKFFNQQWYEKIYIKRWFVETLFQQIKANYSDFKLNLTGKYTRQLKKSKFLLTLISYNFSTIK